MCFPPRSASAREDSFGVRGAFVSGSQARNERRRYCVETVTRQQNEGLTTCSRGKCHGQSHDAMRIASRDAPQASETSISVALAPDAGLSCHDDGLRATADTQFAEYGGGEVAGRPLADAEACGDCAVVQTLSDKLQDLLLTRCETTHQCSGCVCRS